ncbi:MAG: C4-dicarboxylate ABC transporter substrate-binding protein, partial [Pseudomonadota bacterium]
NKWGTVLEVFEKATVEIDGEASRALRNRASLSVTQDWISEASAAGLPAADLLETVSTSLQQPTN